MGRTSGADRRLGVCVLLSGLVRGIEEGVRNLGLVDGELPVFHPPGRGKGFDLLWCAL